MKSVLTIISLLVCSCFIPASEKWADDLHIRVELTTGENSKDSSSETTAISAGRNAVEWEKTFSGRRGGTPPLRKEFELSPADKRNLAGLIESNNLLVTNSIELPQASSNYRYFKISVDLTLGEKKGAINFRGMRKAVKIKEEKLYQTTLILVKELYRIMNSQDKSVLYEELVY